MGTPVNIALGTKSNPARNRQAGNARIINCIAEETGEESKSVWTLYGAPGLRNFGTPYNDGPIRAMIVVNETLYVVSGRDVLAVNSSGVATRIGGIPTDGFCFVEKNRRVPPQVGIVSGGLLHVIDTGSNAVTQVNDPDLPAPISLSFLDGYGILPVANAEFYVTAIDDFTDINGLDSGTAEAFPDPIVNSAVLERELILLGEDSLEFHQDTGSEDFPLTRVHATEIGCLAPNSVAKVDTPSRKTVIFVANDHTVRAINGYSTEVISTNEIEKLIKDLHDAGNIDQLKGFGFASGGRFHYCLTCDGFTRVWSPKVGWSERKSYGLNRWRVGSVMPFGTKLIAGDFSAGNLYELRDDVYDETGDPLIAEVITPHVHAFPYRISMNALYLDMGRGVGLNSSQDHISDPKVLVSWSRDSGLSWSAERERPLGRLGQSAKRVQPIYRLGTAGQHGVIFRLRISAPVERVMISAALDFDRMEP